jgi:hypothetical protein
MKPAQVATLVVVLALGLAAVTGVGPRREATHDRSWRTGGPAHMPMMGGGRMTDMMRIKQ